MRYRSTREVVDDLKRHGRLIEVTEPLSPRLEIAEVQRRVYARGGPAVLFTNPQGCSFPLVSNLFGSIDQARFLFRSTIDRQLSSGIPSGMRVLRGPRGPCCPVRSAPALSRSIRCGYRSFRKLFRGPTMEDPLSPFLKFSAKVQRELRLRVEQGD